MERTISASDLANQLPEILDRVRLRNEQFVIELDGEPVATSGTPTAQPVVTFGEVLAKIGHLSLPGEGFSDDLEEVQASQMPIGPPPEWPD